MRTDLKTAQGPTGGTVGGPVARGVPSPAPDRLRMNPIYFLGWCLFRFCFAVYFRWRADHPERVPLTGPVILAANHASYVDPPLVGAGLRRPCSFLAREDLFDIPIVGWLLREWSVVPVNREGGGAAGLRAILDRLLAGHAVVLFPEGTRSPDGRLQRARLGIGLLVAKSTAPVVPVRVFGSHDAWPKGSKFAKPRRVVVKYGQPMTFDASRAEAKTCSKARLKEIYQQIAEEIMGAISRLEARENEGAA